MKQKALTNAVNNMDSAYKKFFKEHTGLDFESGKVKLPKLKKAKAKLHRRFWGADKISDSFPGAERQIIY